MLTVTDVSRRLACSKYTVYRLVRTGQLDARKRSAARNSGILVTESDLRRYVRRLPPAGSTTTDDDEAA
jgi:excisionase family DNA binding protein